MKKEIMITGGLGNQMFQYAYGRSLIEKGVSISFNTSFFYRKKWRQTTQRDFQLDKFNILEDLKFNKKITLKVFVIKLLVKFKIYTDIYHEDEKYFKNIENIIKKEFFMIFWLWLKTMA